MIINIGVNQFTVYLLIEHSINHVGTADSTRNLLAAQCCCLLDELG